jgi:tRNA-binding protein
MSHTGNLSTTVTVDDFFRADVRVGTVVSAVPNSNAKKAAYVLSIDFGEIGVKTSSAQITERYTCHELIGRRVIAVVNIPPKMIAGVRSEVLVLAAVSRTHGTVLLRPDDVEVPNGTRIL